MMPETCDAMLAIVTMHDDRVIRLLAIHALGFADPEKAIPTLRSLIQDTDGEVAAKAAASLERLSLASPRYKPVRKAAVMYLVDKQAA